MAELQLQEDVPFSIDELTPAWLSSNLRSAGVLERGEVRTLNVRRLGDQVGYNGEVALVELDYSEAEADT